MTTLGAILAEGMAKNIVRQLEEARLAGLAPVEVARQIKARHGLLAVAVGKAMRLEVLVDAACQIDPAHALTTEVGRRWLEEIQGELRAAE